MKPRAICSCALVKIGASRLGRTPRESAASLKRELLQLSTFTGARALEVVLDLDDQVGQPDRAVAGVQPAVQLDEKNRLRRVELLGRVRLEPPPVVVEREPVVGNTFQEAVERDNDTPCVRYVRRPFQRETDFGAASVDYALKDLLASAEDPRQGGRQVPTGRA